VHVVEKATLYYSYIGGWFNVVERNIGVRILFVRSISYDVSDGDSSK